MPRNNEKNHQIKCIEMENVTIDIVFSVDVLNSRIHTYKKNQWAGIYIH